MAATGIEDAGFGWGGTAAAGRGGGGGGGAAAAAGGAADGVTGFGGGGGAAAAGFGLSAGAAAPPVAPMSMLQIFCPGLTVSPSFTNNSLSTPAPGDGTGTEVCEEISNYFF